MTKGKFTGEVLAGEKQEKIDKIPNSFDSDYGEITDTDIDRILKIPDLDDFAGILARANFKNDDERIAALHVIRRLKKFMRTVPENSVTYKALADRLEFVREVISSTIGMRGFGKVLQLQAKTNLVMPEVLREQLSIKKSKNKEDSVKSSDFRHVTEEKEPRMSN